MLRAYLSTLFFIFIFLALGLVTLGVIFGKVGLWSGMILFSLLVLRWVAHESLLFSPQQKEISPNVIYRRFGWFQNSSTYFLSPSGAIPIQLQFFAFRKPSVLISIETFEKMPNRAMKITLLYFYELARIIDSNPWLKVSSIFFSLLNLNLAPRLHRTKEDAIALLQKWHGLDPILIKIRLQQSQYFTQNELQKNRRAYFFSFPKSLPKGLPI